MLMHVIMLYVGKGLLFHILSPVYLQPGLNPDRPGCKCEANNYRFNPDCSIHIRRWIESRLGPLVYSCTR